MAKTPTAAPVISTLYDPATGDLIFERSGEREVRISSASDEPLGDISETIIQAKGDIVVGNAPSAADRVGVGANGLPFVADSGQATGLRWGAEDGSAGVKGLAPFASEPTSNWFRVGAGIMGWAILGVERLRLSATELLVSASLKVKGPRPYYDATTDWGAGEADPTGIVDSLAALDAVTAVWIAATRDSVGPIGATLLVPPGKYKTTAPWVLTFSNDNTSTKRISGYGAYLVPDFASGAAFKITTSGGVVNVRNFTVDGLLIDGSLALDTASPLFHLNPGASGLIYRFAIRDVALQSAKGDGFKVQGDVFEGVFDRCIAAAPASNTTGYGYRFTNAGGGIVSSIDMVACEGIGFLNNVWAETPVGGPKIYGGTYLQARNAGIQIDNNTEGGCWGVHVENAWQDGVADPSWSTNQAGIVIAGRVRVYNCTGTQNNSKMRYVVRAYAANSAVISGGIGISGIDYYCRVEGGAGCHVVVEGVAGGVTGRIHNGLPADGQLLRLACEGDTSALDLTGEAILRRTLTTTGVAAFGTTTSADIGVRVRPTALTTAGQYGIRAAIAGTSAATAAITAVYVQPETAAASFTCADMYGIRVTDAVKGAGSTITRLYGVRIEAPTQGATNIGLYNGGVSQFVGSALVIGAAGLGYGTGAGGAVTQITSAATAVTLNKPTGQITTVALTTAAGAEERFTVNNTLVAATDCIAVGTTYNGAGTPAVTVLKVGANLFDIVITNLHATNALDAVMVINFSVIKGATS